MGTRGFVGVVVEGEVKFAYQQYDSYPSGVGVATLTYIRSLTPGEWDDFFLKALGLEMVREDDKPTPEQIERCKQAGTVNLGVSNQSEDDWYCLARDAQGDLRAILDLGFAVGHPDWPGSSLFCEWGYLVNLDTMTFEVYEGFQQGDVVGRFKDLPREDGHSPVTLAKTFPLNDLPGGDEFVAALEKADA